MREAAARWHAKEGAYRDDITALLVLLDGGRPSVATATATATGGVAAAGGAAVTAAAAGGEAVANGKAKRRGSGGGGGGGGGVAAAALTDTLEFLSVAELAEELSGEALLPPEARR